MTEQTSTAVVPRGGGAAGWLYGPATDLAFGAGLAYLATVPLLAGLALGGYLTAWSIMVTTVLSLFVSGPHYGATILRVYDRREDRQQYVFFAIWATALLIGLFVVGLHSVLLGSILVTAYLTWSPWHYSGQNYGIALMFARRRGIAIEPVTKRFLYASFVFSFVLSILVMHSAASEAAPYSDYLTRESAFYFLPLGVPRSATRVAIWIASIGYVFSIAGTTLLLLRHARPRDLLPVATIALMQSLWFVLPAVAGAYLDGPAFTVAWVAAAPTAHAAQYLWVTSFYASQQAFARGGSPQRDRELRRWWMRALLAGSAVTIFPAIVFAPALLGTLPWDNGLSMLLVAVVNLHHFVLDGAIWKLRDQRVARLLIREVRAGTQAAAGGPAGVRWGRPVVAAVGATCLFVALFDLWERDMVINRAGDDVAAIEGASQRLAWIGRESASAHVMIGAKRSARGEFDEAIRAYRHSLAIYESAHGWRGLGYAHAARGEWGEAKEAYAAALALDPQDTELAGELERVSAVASERASGQPAPALE